VDTENEIKNDIEEKLQECEKLCSEYLSGWQRCKADFLNYKKEEQIKMIEILDWQRQDFVLKTMAIFDAMKMAQEHFPIELKGTDWLSGFLQIVKQFEDFLKQQDVEEIKALGEQFNPDLHEAIEQVEAEGESGMIVGVLEKGYTMNGKLLRPAKVRVVK